VPVLSLRQYYRLSTVEVNIFSDRAAKFQSVYCGWSLPTFLPSHFPASLVLSHALGASRSQGAGIGNMSFSLGSGAKPQLPTLFNTAVTWFWAFQWTHLYDVFEQIMLFFQWIHQTAFWLVITESCWLSRWMDQSACLTRSMWVTWQSILCCSLLKNSFSLWCDAFLVWVGYSFNWCFGSSWFWCSSIYQQPLSNWTVTGQHRWSC